MQGVAILLMKQITLNIKSDKYDVFRAFVESLDYAKIIGEKEDIKTRKKAAIIKSIKAGLKEVELIEKGHLRSTPLKDVLNEL